MAKISSAARRKPGRIILFSTILVVAAAAAMLIMQLRGTPAPPAAVVAPAPASAPVSAPVPAPEVTAEVVDTSAAKVAAPAPEPVKEKPAPKEVVAQVKPFTVRVLPLQNQATDAAKPAVELFYARLLDELRAVPGLTLIAPDTPPDYELTVRGSGPVLGTKFAVSIAVGRSAGMVNSVMVNSVSTSSTTGDIVSACAGAAPQPANPPCADAASLAASTVYSLRTRTFPPDPSLRQQLQAQLLDKALDPAQRFKALSDLGGLRRPSPGERTNGPMDPAAVQGAIKLVADARDPALRAQIWYTLRGVRDPELVGPLVASLQQDPDGEVRLQVLGILAADFADDARTRSAFEIAAREETRPLVRALAQRNLSGDATWKQYMVSSLKDTNRPIAERVEAFMYYMYKPGPGGISFTAGGDEKKLLDQEVVQALAQALPQAIALPTVKMVVGQLTYDLDRVDKQLTINLLLDSLEKSTEPAARTAFVSLLSRRNGDARVRAALEKISSSDEDPKLREMAASAVKAAVPVVQ